MRAEGLLEQIADTALDDDYYVVRAGDYAQSREFNTPLTALVLAVFALLVVMAAVQTRNDRPATERERSTLISDVAARKKAPGQPRGDRRAAPQGGRRPVRPRSTGSTRPTRTFASRPATSPPPVRASPSWPAPARRAISTAPSPTTTSRSWSTGSGTPVPRPVAINGERIGTHDRHPLRQRRDQRQLQRHRAALHRRGDRSERHVAAALRGQSRPVTTGHARQKNAAVQFGVTPSSDLSVPAVPKKRMTIRHATAIKGEE